MGADDHKRAGKVKGFKGSPLPRGRAPKAGELSALFDACDATTAQGARDAALLAVLYGAGLRRAEAAALDLSDYDLETGALTVRAGKGRKARTVYATNGAKAALHAWLDARGAQAGPLYLPVDKAGNVRFQVGDRAGRAHQARLTPQAVYVVLGRVARSAKVKDLSPHDLRRGYITALLNSGVNIAVVQKLAGHASVNTTARSDRSDEDAKRRVSELLHVPFAG